MKRIINEFMAFMDRGSAVDMAVGIIIATAFSAVTSALVNNIFMPLIGLATSGTDFAEALNWVVVAPKVGEAGEILDPGVTVGFGHLLSAGVNFIIIALFCFVIVKSYGKAKKMAASVMDGGEKEAEAENAAGTKATSAVSAPETEEELLREIRDLLRSMSER